MEGMFNKLLDRDNPEKKLQKEIESTQFRKQSMISVVQGEVREAVQKREGLFCQIGKAEYENKGKALALVHTEQFAEIDALTMQIEEKVAKIKEIESRYDEEIALLSRSLTPSVPATVVSMARGQRPCPKCGAGYEPGVDRFCVSCGSDLPSTSAVPAETGVGAGAQLFCPNCGSKYTAGEDLFCDNCGQKLG
jgi:hypothetical protein